MMNQKEQMKGFLLASGVLPERLWRTVFSLSEEERLQTEEFRIRLGRPLTAVLAGREKELCDNEKPVLVSREDVEETMARATRSSVHTYEDQIRQGFITIGGGHRLGICGEAVIEGGAVRTIRMLSSLNLRVARELPGFSAPIYQLCTQPQFQSMLILSPPGGGKTTLLRDLARGLSQEYTVAIADERMEIAACREGEPQFCVGMCDVLSGCPKEQAVDLLLRSMSPQVIALDEITREEDVKTLMAAANTGCRFLTTAHAFSLTDLHHRPIYRMMMDSSVFQSVIVIERTEGKRRYTVYQEVGEKNGQAARSDTHRRILFGHRIFHERGAYETRSGAQELFNCTTGIKGGDCF